MDPIAVYVHTPFCPSKCGYCDFNSFAMDGEIIDRTVKAICQEILRSSLRGAPAKTIFFGGGTPTFLSGEQLDSLLKAVFEVHPPIEGCEITSEANPGTVDASKFSSMRESGWNRISLGAQSFLDSDLLRLERVHKAGEIERAVLAAREAGFDNVNLDLMFALPDQSRHAWRSNLERALALEPEHLSLYCLTIEQNTAFYKKNLRGELNLPDDDSQRDMYEDCLRICAERGYEQYEISNFSKPGRECQHNLCYWYGEAYAGYGPGAVGCLPLAPDLLRYTNLKHPERYCQAVENGDPIPFESEIIDVATQRTERIMLGLRLNKGVSHEGLPQGALAKLEQRGWIGRDNQRVWLTAEGRHFCSEVALELI
jgi:oxygen-independent coproporphyrinogen-3 oxidase